MCRDAELPVNSVGYMALPPNGTNVEITVEAEHYATPQTPIVVDGLRWPQFWRLILEGKFGFLWTPPETLPRRRRRSRSHCRCRMGGNGAS